MEYEARMMFNAAEQYKQQLAMNQMGCVVSSATDLGWAPISRLNPEVKAWVPNAAAKCFACKGTGEKQCPFNPEDVTPCECKK
jgi:hypothetical protein